MSIKTKNVKKVLDICNYAFVTEDLSVQTLEELGFKECNVIVIYIGEQMDTAIFATLNTLSLNAGKVISMASTEELGKVLE